MLGLCNCVIRRNQFINCCLGRITKFYWGFLSKFSHRIKNYLMKIDREFPFSHVIVTAPSPPIAELYNIQLRQLQDSFAFLAKCCMICVSDPIEGRVGSGGGTWNAMAVAIQHIGLSACNETKVLVIHSGGESRRLPTHSLCGKAWLSMNHKLNDEVVCPLLLLIMESVELCQNLSPPYIVVGCGDVLLQLKTKGELKDLSDGVYIVSVLANESTAQNHGVVTINDELRTLPVGDKATQVLNAADYLQKPSPSDMEYHKAFVSTESVNSRLVLIDTGLVIFCGAPVMEMFNLAKHYSPSSVNPWSSIQIDMFLEVLFACQKEGCIETNAQYKSKLMRTSSSFTNDVYMDAIDTIYRTMNTIPLRTVICNFGQFYHLGTMNEILDVFLHEETSGGYTNGETSKSIQSIAHCGSSEIVKIGSYLHPSVVISSPFERGFVEYSHLSDCYIPSRCVISHIDASTASRVGRFLQDCVFQKAYMNCIEGSSYIVPLLLKIC